MESKNNNDIGVGYGNVNTKPKENNQDPEEKLVQYDLDGKYIETWNSLKEITHQCVSDYINIVDALNAENIVDKQTNDSYFFWEKDLIKHFNAVPKKIKNLPQTPKEIPVEPDVIRKPLPSTNIGDGEKIILPDGKVIDLDEPAKIPLSKGKIHYIDFMYPDFMYPKTPKKRMTTRYTVIEYDDDDGNIINDYENVYEAGYRLKLTRKTVSDICRGNVKDAPFNLKYGEKEQQAVELNYPEYTPQTLWDVKTNGRSLNGSKYTMKFTILVYRYGEYLEYKEKNMLDDLSPIATYDHIKHAAKEMNLTEIAIQNIILKGYSVTLNVVIEYGERKRYTKRNLDGK